MPGLKKTMEKTDRSADAQQVFRTHISSGHRIFDLHLREAFQYRDLVFLLVGKNFKAQYKQTVLGPAWAVINPLLTTFVLNFVFGNLAGLTRADTAGNRTVPAFLFYLSGNICWGYFSSVLNATSSTFLANRATMGKVYYPRIVAPVATAFSHLISFAIQFVLFACVWAWFVIRGGTDIAVTPRLLMVPVLILQMMCLSVGLGIIVSSVTTKYRDLHMLVGFGLGLWRYACPIAYGLQLIPQRHMGWFMLNPMTPILTTFRCAVFGFGYFDPAAYAVSWGVTALALLAGLVLFSRIERTFMDTI